MRDHRMATYPELLPTLGVALGFGLLLSVRKPWGRTARRIIGTTILVCSIAAVTIWATVAYIVFLSLGE